jgi:hypothetical protein
MMTPHDITRRDARELLRHARELLSDPTHWTKGAEARAEDGDECGIEYAACWCADGAMRCAALRYGRAAWREAKPTIECLVPGLVGLEQFNDMPATTHADVLALFDRAIAKLSEVQL